LYFYLKDLHHQDFIFLIIELKIKAYGFEKKKKKTGANSKAAIIFRGIRSKIVNRLNRDYSRVYNVI
jgi:hypothetical protein